VPLGHGLLMINYPRIASVPTFVNPFPGSVHESWQEDIVVSVYYRFVAFGFVNSPGGVSLIITLASYIKRGL
jgi:hypothetical protein